MQVKEEYSTPAETSDVQENIEYAPESLVHLLRVLLSGKDIDLKLSSLGQALTQASRPRTLMPPLQLGLGVQLHHKFASKFLIQSLNRLGFSLNEASVALVYQRLPKVDVEDTTSNVDLLWKTSLLLRSPRPCWSGVMQHVQHGLHPEPSTIKFLPIIDMDPSDLT